MGQEAADPLTRALASPDSLQVFLLTFGRGDRVWERFGHNALWIHDGPAGTDRVYNWGIFDFEQANFIPRLLTGQMRYRLAVFPLEGTMRQYRLADRSVFLQQLRLTPAQRRELQRRVRVNARPGNRRYSYDPYRDNCSTRIRDHLNRVLDGRLRAVTGSLRTDRTWRSHTLRLLRRDFWPYLGLAVGMGQPADEELTAWEEMFFPLRMRDRLRSVHVPSSGGATVPLIAREDTLHLASRPPVPTRPPGRTLPFLLASTVVGGLLLGLGRLAGRGSRPARHLFGALRVLWTGLVGVVGSAMIAAWAFTDHWFQHTNENLLQAHLLFLVLAVLLVLCIWREGRDGAGSWYPMARRTAWCLAAIGLIGALLQVLPGFDQVNGSALALLLPVHLGLAAGLERMRRRQSLAPMVRRSRGRSLAPSR